MPLPFRRLAYLVLPLLLVACQHAPPAATPAPVDPIVQDLQAFEQLLQAGQLTEAQVQLESLQQQRPNEPRLEGSRRQLAEAYLLQGEAFLRQGQRKAAAGAFAQARRWLPVVASSAPTSPAKPPVVIAKKEQPVTASPAKARVINPAAASSAVALPMLDSRDNKSLRTLLDAVAADVVRYRCAVHIEVRESKDYPWVAALLSARVKKLQPGFILALSSKIDPNRAPRLLLSPAL
ncbi:MAG: hypothetical protein ABWY06_15775 [Pseudomonas sp.]|uniref:hypothetical protein n=1 Tax=Pseudomonas sp. TaxID=306 RepID=UPI003393CB2D